MLSKQQMYIFTEDFFFCGEGGVKCWMTLSTSVFIKPLVSNMNLKSCVVYKLSYRIVQIAQWETKVLCVMGGRVERLWGARKPCESWMWVCVCQSDRKLAWVFSSPMPLSPPGWFAEQKLGQFQGWGALKNEEGEAVKPFDWPNKENNQGPVAIQELHCCFFVHIRMHSIRSKPINVDKALGSTTIWVLQQFTIIYTNQIIRPVFQTFPDYYFLICI